MPRSRHINRVRLGLEPLEGRALLDGGPVTIAGDQFVRDGTPVFLNIIGYQPLEPGQDGGDPIRVARIQEDLGLMAGFQGGSDPIALRVYAQPTPTLPVRMPQEFYDGVRDLGFWIIRDVYFDGDYWAADAIARGQAKVDAVLGEVQATGGQDRVFAWEIGNEFAAQTQEQVDALKGLLNAMVAYTKTRVHELWPTGVSDYVTWASWPPSDPLRTDGVPVVVNTLDFVSYNAYSYEPSHIRDHQGGPGTGTPFAGYLADLKGWFEANGLNVPLVLSETGYPDYPTADPQHAQFHPWAPQYRKGALGSQAVAEGLADRYWDARLSGSVAGFGLFEWLDEWWKAGTPALRDHPEEAFGIIEFDPGTLQARPKPQFATIRSLYSMSDTPGLIQSLAPASATLGPEGRTTVTVQLSGQAATPVRLRWEASRGYIIDTLSATDTSVTVEFYAGGRALGPATITAIALDALGRVDTATTTIAIQPPGQPTIETLTLGTTTASGRVANVDLDLLKVAVWIKTDTYWVQPYLDMTSVRVRPDGYWWTEVHNNNDGDLYAAIVPKDYDPLNGPPGGAPTATLTEANDSDNDLLPDTWEVAGLGGLQYARYSDPDADGADNLEEFLAGTLPGVPDNDSDQDGLLDNWERTYFGMLDHGAAADPDRDGLSNLAEQALGTHPARGPRARGAWDPRYVGAIPAGGGAVVHVYDTDATPDVTLADVAVKPGAGNAVSSITLVGAQRKTGLGILITGASSVGKISDKRTLAAPVAFIASTAPIASLSLRSSLAGHNLNGLTLGGVTFAQDLDGDGNLNDATALWVQGSVAKLSLAGNLSADAVVQGTLASMTVTGAVAGDVRATGSLAKASVTGGWTGDLAVSWLGSARVGGTASGVWTATGADPKKGASVGSLAVGRWGAGSILAAGVGHGPDGAYLTGDDTIVGGGLGKLTIAALDTANPTPFGITAPQFGKLSVAGTSLTQANLPFAQGQFRIILAQETLHKGVALPLWDETVNLTQLRATLDNLVALGVNWVEVNVFWFQDDISSSEIAPDFTRWSASDASVRTVLDEIHLRGMKVLLKPMVDLRNDPTHWRGDIPGSDAWFTGPQGYGAFLNHFADIAQQESAAMFCVGTELVAASSKEPQWRALIAGVRARYSGPLVYAANHGGTGSATQENIAWWDALDYIGLDAYYPLTTKLDPTLAELQAAWAARSATIENWLAALDPADRKPVLFTEVGYRSWDGANIAPFSQANQGNTAVDLQEQADCYQALLTTLWGQETWFLGVYWWNWEVDPNAASQAQNWYTPQGKPAEGILQLYYS